MSNELALIPSNDELKTMMQLADVFVKSGRFANDKDVAQALVKIQAGREIGLSPFQSMSSIYFVNGVRALHYSVIGAKIQESGRYRYKVLELDNKHCKLQWLEKLDGVWEVVGESKFDEDEAKAAGLVGKDNWKKWTESMYFARALTKGQRMFAPAIFNGPAYDPSELTNTPVDLEVETKEWNPSFQEFLNKAQIEIDPSLTKEKVVDYLRDNGFSWTTDAKPKMWLALQEKFSKSDNITEAEIA